MGVGAVTERQPTTLGWYITRKMAELGLTQTDLARRSGLAQASISRYIYAAGRPDTDKLGMLAAGLSDQDGPERERIYQDLLSLAGHGTPGEAHPVAVPPAHRLAREIDAMLADTSPIPADKRQVLEGFLDNVLDTYRPLMRRRRPA